MIEEGWSLKQIADFFYLLVEKSALVMLDAFEAHKHKGMNEMLKQVDPLAQQAIRLMGDGE